MNENPSSSRHAIREAAEQRFARGIAACLTERSERLPPGIDERLRFARSTALESARRQRALRENEQGVGSTAAGAAIAGFSRSRWWLRLATILPMVALVGGLMLIQDRTMQNQISVAAEIDAALLGGDLPIGAYRDAGFAEFLKSPPRE